MTLPEDAKETLEEAIEKEQERKERERREATKYGTEIKNDE